MKPRLSLEEFTTRELIIRRNRVRNEIRRMKGQRVRFTPVIFEKVVETSGRYLKFAQYD